MSSELWCSGWITLHGAAKPQGSKKAIVNRRTGRAMLVDDCPQARPWRNDLSLLMRQQAPPRPLRAPMRVDFIVYVNRPKAQLDWAGAPKEGAPQHPATGIDLDKVARAIGDAGTGIWWCDDDQICGWCAYRCFTEGEPCVDVRAFALDAEPEVKAQRRVAACAAELVARTVTQGRFGWADWLGNHPEPASARARVRKALKEQAGQAEVTVVFTAGEWVRLQGSEGAR